MRVSRPVIVLLLLACAVAGAGAFWFAYLRQPTGAGQPRTASTPPVSGAASQSPRSTSSPETLEAELASQRKSSEELIAAALKAGDITYEESLLQRAYGVFGDPRLDKAFQSPVVDWESATPLWFEIDEKASTLSRELLADLAPFRARPNDPISIFNAPPAPRQSARGIVRLSYQLTVPWVSMAVPGTRIRVWIQSTLQILETKYAPMMAQVWPKVPRFFPHPLADLGDASKYDPDDLVDVYLVRGQNVDPRDPDCNQNPYDPETCTLRTDWGVMKAIGLTPTTGTGWVLVNISKPDNEILEATAHELSHAAQMGYTLGEIHSLWLSESTAAWVGYKVAKALGKRPGFAYMWLNKAKKQKADLSELFTHLHLTVTSIPLMYSGWLYFNSASFELGDNLVKDVWQRAARAGQDSWRAADEAVPFERHFPKFALRNWNQDPVPQQYVTRDGTFDTGLRPDPIKDRDFSEPFTMEIPGGQLALTADYYRFRLLPVHHRLIVQNLFTYLPPGTSTAQLWAIRKVNGTWKPPEDWTAEAEKMFCRDIPDEKVDELVLVLMNTALEKALPLQSKVRVIGDDIGCTDVVGWAQSTLRLRDDSQDVRYTSSKVPLRFKARAKQDPTTRNVEYDLSATSIIWTASGRIGDCIVKGSATIGFPDMVNKPFNAAIPAEGYLNVVSRDDGDFHSVIVLVSDPKASVTKECPNMKPQKHYVPAALLLQILHQPNTHDPAGVVYKGTQTFDPARLIDSLPGPGQIEALRQLQAAQQSEVGKMVYTFTWELTPLSPP